MDQTFVVVACLKRPEVVLSVLMVFSVNIQLTCADS